MSITGQTQTAVMSAAWIFDDCFPKQSGKCLLSYGWLTTELTVLLLRLPLYHDHYHPLLPDTTPAPAVVDGKPAACVSTLTCSASMALCWWWICLLNAACQGWWYFWFWVITRQFVVFFLIYYISVYFVFYFFLWPLGILCLFSKKISGYIWL